MLRSTQTPSSPPVLDVPSLFEKQFVYFDVAVLNEKSESTVQNTCGRWDSSEYHIGDLSVQDVETRPFAYEWVRFAEYSLAFKRPIWLTPIRSQCGQYLEASLPELRIVLSAPTKQELREDFEETLEFLWGRICVGPRRPIE